MSLFHRRIMAGVLALIFAIIFMTTIKSNFISIVLLVWGAGMTYRAMMYWTVDDE